jgi:hypothetical protein
MPTVGWYACVRGVLTVAVRIFLSSGWRRSRSKEGSGEPAINWNLFVFLGPPPDVLSDMTRRLEAARVSVPRAEAKRRQE